MRRVIGVGFAIAIALTAIAVAVDLRSIEEASADQSVTIRVWETFTSVPTTFGWKEGDACRFPANRTSEPDQNRQLILRNQDDRIVSVVDLGGAKLAAGNEAGSWHCILTTSVSIPDFPFLAVYLDGEWVRAFTPETLTDGINLNLTVNS